MSFHSNYKHDINKDFIILQCSLSNDRPKNASRISKSPRRKIFTHDSRIRTGCEKTGSFGETSTKTFNKTSGPFHKSVTHSMKENLKSTAPKTNQENQEQSSSSILPMKNVKNDFTMHTPLVKYAEPTINRVDISQLTPDMRHLSMKFIVVDVFEPKFTTKGEVTRVRVADPSGSCLMNIWDKELANYIKPSQIWKLENGITRVYRERLHLGLSQSSKFKKIGEFLMSFVMEPDMSANKCNDTKKNNDQEIVID